MRWKLGQVTNRSLTEAPRRGWLGRLARDVRGNTLAIMAVSIIPVAGLTGSAIDAARLYVVKVRLQQACDAGVLAGRRFLVIDDSDTLDANAATQGQNFFRNNFPVGFFGTTASNFTPVRTPDDQVSGTATATTPMAVMQMFGFQPVSMTATCQARFDIADVDVMFVLDVTGSMSCSPADNANCFGTAVSYTRPDGTTGWYSQEKTSGGVNVSKIQGVRTAVLDFYDTLVSAADPSTHIRYGFVPYTSLVNVGPLLPSNLLSSSGGDYQSRRVIGDANDGSATNTNANKTKAQCDALVATGAVRSPATGWDSNGKATKTTYSWQTSSGGYCRKSVQNLIPNWKYQQYKSTDSNWQSNVAGYIASASGGPAVTDPTKVIAATSKWRGCVETKTVAPTDTINPNNLPWDINPDYTPTDDDHRWRPLWPDQVYDRSSSPQTTSANNTNLGSSASEQGMDVTCGKRAQRLTTMTRDEVSAYVNATDFKAHGRTYHDIGMIWGARLISPTGPFATDTAPWPNRNAPSRNIVFMTDGYMQPDSGVYGQYGLEKLDQRIGGNSTTLTSRHNKRFVAACNAAKARNVTVWVIAFSAATTLTQEERDCASPGKAFYASDTATLQQAFRNIAQQLAMLRLTQ